MRADQNKAAYEKRMLRVFRYIFNNLDGDLSLDTLADVACMSRFHWHRVFQSMTGEPLAAAIRRIRLCRASVDLLQTNEAIAEISIRYGYPTAQSFTRAFKAEYGLAPGGFRDSGNAPLAFAPKSEGVFSMHQIYIKEMPEQSMLALPNTGPYHDLGMTFGNFAAMLVSRGLIQQAGPFAGIYYDDPGIVPAEELRSHAGAIFQTIPEKSDGFETLRIPAGRFAVLRHKGPYAGLKVAYKYLFGEWLPSSGEEVADIPCYDIFHNSPTNTAPEDLIVDVCLQLA